MAIAVKMTLIGVMETAFLDASVSRSFDLCRIFELMAKRRFLLPRGSGQVESSTRSRETEDINGDTMTDSVSFKYGVTYSVSEITGISDSRFMVP
jgi:hypothetical protein